VKSAPPFVRWANITGGHVRFVLILALKWLALGVNLGAGCDRAVLFGLAFGDLELDNANSGLTVKGATCELDDRSRRSRV
jgi:hypothetical protein